MIKHIFINNNNKKRKTSKQSVLCESEVQNHFWRITFYLLPKVGDTTHLMIERFSIDVRKINTKAITRTNHQFGKGGIDFA